VGAQRVEGRCARHKRREGRRRSREQVTAQDLLGHSGRREDQRHRERGAPAPDERNREQQAAHDVDGQRAGVLAEDELELKRRHERQRHEPVDEPTVGGAHAIHEARRPRVAGLQPSAFAVR